MDSIKWVMRYVRPYKFRFILGIIFVLGVSACNMVNPKLSGRIIDEVMKQGNKEVLVPILITMICVVLLKSVIRYGYQFFFEYISQNAIYNIRKDMYTKLQELDFDFYDHSKTGDIMTKMTGDIDRIRHFIVWVTLATVENVTLFVFAIVMMSLISIKLTLIMLLITPIVGIVAYRMSRVVKPAFQSIRRQFSRLNSTVEENISGNRVVKAFAKEDYEIQKFEKENSRFKQRNLDANKIWQKFLPVLDCFAGSMVVFMIFFGGIIVINGEMTIGDLVAFNGMLWALNNPMRMIGNIINDIQNFRASAEKIVELLKTEPKIKNTENCIKDKHIQGDVEFKDVFFDYEDVEVLKNISFKAKAGETIGIIGPTGSGKSTLVNLICRFYDVTKGEVLIDDTDIKRYEVRELRAQIASAMQDIFLFSDTIEGNIAYGDPNVSQEKVIEVSKAADAYDFINNMPEGYDTIIGERGVGLSGGQKQRIALARALLKDPSILILDDTTSAVDMETEHEIQNTLKKYMKGKTSFIIAHRISSVSSADQILVLDHGEIIEHGTHQELVEKKGYYYSVYMNQCGDFNDDNVKEVG